MDKKGDWYQGWTERLFWVALILGVILGFISGSAFVTYTIALLCGMAFSRIFIKYKNSFRMAWTLMIIAFIIGFSLARRFGDRRIIIIMFVLGILIGIYVNKKGWFKAVGL